MATRPQLGILKIQSVAGLQYRVDHGYSVITLMYCLHWTIQILRIVIIKKQTNNKNDYLYENVFSQLYFTWRGTSDFNINVTYLKYFFF